MRIGLSSISITLKQLSNRQPTRIFCLVITLCLLFFEWAEAGTHCGCQRDWVAFKPIGLRPFNMFQVLDAKRWLALGPTCLQMTANAGHTWQDLFCIDPSTAHDPNTRLRALQAPSAQHIYILQGHSVLQRTLDGGKQWERFDFPQKIIRNIHFIHPMHGWIVGEISDTTRSPDIQGFILETHTGGETWLSTGPKTNPEYRWRFVDIAVASDGAVWTIGDHLYVRSSTGAIWQNAQMAVPQWFDERNVSIRFSNKGFGRILRLLATTMYLTNDDGKSWHLVSPPPGIRQVDDVLQGHNGAIWLAAGLLYCSADFGTTWQAITTDAQQSPVYQLAQTPSLDYLIVTGSNQEILIGYCNQK